MNWNEHSTIGEYTYNEFIENLTNDDFYYSPEGGGLALSASDLKKYVDSKIPIRKEAQGFIHALEFGRATHQMFLEPDKFDQIDFLGDELTLKDYDHLIAIKEAVLANDEARELLEQASHTEKAFIRKFNGHWLKCKADFITDGVIWDIKTTGNINSFDYTSRRLFEYPLSAYQYYLITGMVMHYVVIEKNSCKVEIRRTDEEYYKEGYNKWCFAWNRYLKAQQMTKLLIGNYPELDLSNEELITQENDGNVYAWVSNTLNNEIE